MPPVDLLVLTAELVDVRSVSFEEAELTALLEERLRALPRLEVERVGANLVARTQLGRSSRIVLAGHTDTVPPNGNERARIEHGVLWGLGSADMKGGLAVMLALAEQVPEPAVDVTWVFYAGEEVAAAHNGLAHLARDRPDLLAGDLAILGEPTGGEIEAGCQGTMQVEVVLQGERAHSARPWMGRNALHRLGPLLRAIEAYQERRPVIEGCEYREALQAVAVAGGVAGNVVPDQATLRINHRFAPDRSPVEAEEWLRALLAPHLEDGDRLEVVDLAPAAAPGLGHPALRALIEAQHLPVRAKLGWTDVARFAEVGVPACNLGPGDPRLAHSAQERVERSSLERTYEVLEALLTTPVRAAATG